MKQRFALHVDGTIFGGVTRGLVIHWTVQQTSTSSVLSLIGWLIDSPTAVRHRDMTDLVTPEIEEPNNPIWPVAFYVALIEQY